MDDDFSEYEVDDLDHRLARKHGFALTREPDGKVGMYEGPDSGLDGAIILFDYRPAASR